MTSILYITREGENEELRYSLRSLRFMPHSQVVIVGGIPSWVNRETVTCVEREQPTVGRHDAWVTKYENARENLRTGLYYLTAQNAVLMNDDFFLTQEVQEAVLWRLGGAEAFRKAYKSEKVVASRYVEGELNTLAWCREMFDSAQSYALHVPFPFIPHSMEALLHILPFTQPPMHIRTAYGNYCGGEGEIHPYDPKITGNTRKRPLTRLNGQVIERPVELRDLPVPYVSTNERSFQAFEIGKKIRLLHPNKSPYEL